MMELVINIAVGIIAIIVIYWVIHIALRYPLICTGIGMAWLAIAIESLICWAISIAVLVVGFIRIKNNRKRKLSEEADRYRNGIKRRLRYGTRRNL